MIDKGLKEIFSKEQIEEALQYILSRKNSCGIDGIMVDDFGEYWEMNGGKIIDLVLVGEYRPAPVKIHELVMATGKYRKIALYTCTDRLIGRILATYLQEKIAPLLSEHSYAYQQKKGILNAVQQAAGYMEEGKVWVLELDIENYFDNINLKRMEGELEAVVEDEGIRRLIHRYLYCDVAEDECVPFYIKEKGLVQGSSLSPALSNLYLCKLDKIFEEKGLSFCRFGDDINIYFEDRLQAVRCYPEIRKYLENEFFLKLNNRKGGIYPAMNRVFLGYTFKKERAGKVLITKKPKKKTVCYTNWQKSALQYTGREYHIINEGILTKKDYTVLFENEQGKRYLPSETTDKINIYSDVILTSGFLEYISKRNIDLAIFNKYGQFCGAFYGKKHAATSNMILKQVTLYNNEEKRLAIAKGIIIAAVHNMRANIRYYCKKHKIKRTDVEKITDFIPRMNEARTVQDLMLIEAQCRQYYYTYMGQIIDSPEFPFSQRIKRPPTDEVNAMISFGNVFLYERIATEINKTSLDIKVGFLHSTNKRLASLNLDIAEIFKPIIIDRTVFTVIHKKILSASAHFQPMEKKGIYLNAAGKRIFINEIMKKLYTKITINNRTTTYNAIIRNEVWKIYKMIEKDEPYKPYKYNN